MSSRKLHNNAIENPTLELKIVSASGVSYFEASHKLDVYAIVSIIGGTKKKQTAKTPIDFDGGSNPTWNHTVKFSLNEEVIYEGLITLYVKLYSYWLEDEHDLYLGEVNVSVRELLASNTNGDVHKMKSVTYPIKLTGETKPKAKLTLSYRFKPVPVKDLYPPPQAPAYLPPFRQPVYPNPDHATLSQPIIYSPQFQTTSVTKLAIELVIKSANDIRNVNVFDDMDVYASVLICKDRTTVKHKTKTPIAYSGFKFPTWDHPVKFSFDEDEELAGLTLVVELMSHRPVLGDKHIGYVKIQIKELIDSNPPSSLTNPNASDMKLVTHKVISQNGPKGTLKFAYRFLNEQVTTPIGPGLTPQPFIMYIPVPHHSYGSAEPVHGTSGYMDVHPGPGANVGPSSGLIPMYMPPQYHPHMYQPQPQQQLQPQKLQHQPQPQPKPQPQPQPQPHQHLSQPLQPQPPPPPQRPTQSQEQAQGARPQVKPQGGGMAALGLGAAALGRVIGGTLLNEMISDEVNIYEVGFGSV